MLNYLTKFLIEVGMKAWAADREEKKVNKVAERNFSGEGSINLKLYYFQSYPQ